MRFLKYTLALFLLNSTLVFSQSYAFHPSQQFYQNSIELQNPSGLDGLFKNPASTSLGEATVFQFKSSNTNLGYQPIHACALAHFNVFNLGFSYFQMGSSDLIGATKTGSERPVETIAFSDLYRSFSASAGTSFFEPLYLGTSLKWVQTQLANDSASAIIGDIGGIWTLNSTFQIDAYTRNLFQTPFKWNLSKKEESFQREFWAGLSCNLYPLSIALFTNLERIEAKGEWGVLPQFSLVGGIQSQESSLNPETYTLGLNLNLNPVEIDYLYASQGDSSLQWAQHSLGLKLKLN